MDRYDYRAEMIADVTQWIKDNYTAAEIAEKLEDRDAWEEELNDELWIVDSVTGNASGSYWFSREKASEALCYNWSLLAEAMDEFCCERNAIKEGPEWADVIIRCYLLGEAIYTALDSLEGQYNDDIVTNKSGFKVDFDAASVFMDDDIVEQLHRKDWNSTQDFFTAYEHAHADRYGEEWELSKPNPAW